MEADEGCCGAGLDGAEVGGGEVGRWEVGLGVGLNGRSWDWESASSWERRLDLLEDIVGNA